LSQLSAATDSGLSLLPRPLSCDNPALTASSSNTRRRPKADEAPLLPKQPSVGIDIGVKPLELIEDIVPIEMPTPAPQPAGASSNSELVLPKPHELQFSASRGLHAPSSPPRTRTKTDATIAAVATPSSASSTPSATSSAKSKSGSSSKKQLASLLSSSHDETTASHHAIVSPRRGRKGGDASADTDTGSTKKSSAVVRLAKNAAIVGTRHRSRTTGAADDLRSKRKSSDSDGAVSPRLLDSESEYGEMVTITSPRFGRFIIYGLVGADLEPFCRLLALLNQPDFGLFSALCERDLWVEGKSQSAIESIVSVFIASGRGQELVQRVIRREVSLTEQETTLFRSVSMSTQILSTFAKQVGTQYLRQVIRPLVLTIISTPWSFEVDPDKLEEGEQVMVNTLHLVRSCEDMLQHIVATIDQCPRSLWRACKSMFEIVNEKFPSSALKSVGGLFFLRFVCPAIMVPETSGVLDSAPTEQQRRKLVLVSKSLQSLSNAVEFGAKEPYMMGVNKFIRNGTPQMQTLQQRLAVSLSPLSLSFSLSSRELDWIFDDDDEIADSLSLWNRDCVIRR